VILALKLAKEGCRNRLCKTWFSRAPGCIFSALTVDSVDVQIKLQPIPLKKNSSPLTIDEKEVTTETHKSHI
jgi:hypothetical protein